MAKKIIPFGWLPGHMGLAGKTREIAKAEYELDGYELEKRLLELSQADLKDEDYTRKVIELDFKHKKIESAQYQRLLVDLITDEKQKSLATAELDYREGKTKQLEYEKQIATIKGEPWISVLSMEFGGQASLEGSFELDWNEMFVEDLIKNGYVGPSPDHIVNQWFMEVCKNVALQEYDGTGNFTADAEANLQAMKRWEGSVAPATDGKKAYK